MHFKTRFLRSSGRPLAIPALFALVAAVSFSGGFAPGVQAQSPEKKVVKTEADLPRFNYPLTTTATSCCNSTTRHSAPSRRKCARICGLCF